MKQAAMSEIFEIKSSELADQKGIGESKRFANEMSKDHSQSLDKLKVHSGESKGLERSYESRPSTSGHAE